MMRRYTVVILVLLTAQGAFAQADRPKRDQVAAATDAAVRGLKEAVSKDVLANSVTVQTLLDKTGGHDKLTDVLRRAEQIGGPRWVNETCQVRLEISGTRVAAALVQIAAAQPKKSPISADVLAVKLTDWNGRTFSANGSSTGAAEIEHARPGGENGAWSRVSDEARRTAVAQAKEDAISQTIESVKDVRVPSGKTAGEALTNPATREQVSAWLAARPVTEVVFRDDLNVGVSLSAPPAEFFEAFRDALRAAEPDAPAWETVKTEFAQRVGAPTGSAAVGGAPAAQSLPPLPTLPPVWTNQQIEAEGSAAVAGSKLKCARAAEAAAAKNLAAQIDSLPLTPDVTIAQAAERDPRIRNAIYRATARARTYKVEYDTAGGARVRVQLNLREVWDELRGPQ